MKNRLRKRISLFSCQPRIIFYVLGLCLGNTFWSLYGGEISFHSSPWAVITNPCAQYCLVNSVDYHPTKNLFCVTYTQCNQVVVYKNEESGKPQIIQTLSNPSAILSEPQHAIFSHDGEKLIVANWSTQTLSIYQADKNSLFSETPAAIIPSPNSLSSHKPHGMAISPCGNFLAVAYGAANYYERAIALFRICNRGIDLELVSILQGEKEFTGTPKGITFSPDGNCLLVTFSDTNSLLIFDFDRTQQAILPMPRQVIHGKKTKLSRPEDVKISSKGGYCAITNSDEHTVTFYPFDSTLNLITQCTPSFILQNPEAQHCFPHGIAFSPDGCFMLVTEFGPVKTRNNGDIFWKKDMRPDKSKINIYALKPVGRDTEYGIQNSE